jgi:pimeloyl-ACP methyl ester carboxylesterase
MRAVTYRKVDVDGIGVFYREAGPKDAPTLLLLHGFPTASHMFRDLIPQLADRFHVAAPDLPGFGQSDMPERTKFSYTFDNIAAAIDRFTEVIGLDRFAIYVFDYGAPTGFRLAVRHPERITAIISQNGNAYVEGLSDGWNPIRHTGRTRPKQTAKPSAPFFRPRQRSGNTPTASPTPPRFLRTGIRSTTSISHDLALMKCSSSGSLGQERPVFSAAGRRGVQA